MLRKAFIILLCSGIFLSGKASAEPDSKAYQVSSEEQVSDIVLQSSKEETLEAIVEKINEVKALIRGELAHRIQLRFTPELDFFLDDTLDYVEKIEGLIKKIHEHDDKKGNE